MNGVAVRVKCGSIEVFENRDTRTGRRIRLDVVVLPSRSETPAPDPVFLVAGGPGQAATRLAPGVWPSPLRDRREIVLVDQRGTGGSHALDCSLPGSDANLQGYFDPIFRVETFEACRDSLARRADLRRYSTETFAHDLEDVREALGYEHINLVGQSYGTRASLSYARRYPARVRTAYLTGLVPSSFKNPLYHARSAQDALDRLLDACAADTLCHAAFPNLRHEIDSIVARLDRRTALATITHPANRAPVEIQLSRTAFAEALRVMMYRSNRASHVPLFIHRAYRQDFGPFAELGLDANRGIRGGLRLGMLMSVVCTEDVSRIRESEIERETRGTLIGDSRVREQRAACGVWPQGDLPEDHADPVVVDVPMLLVSGTLDPVTPPRWGAETARHLPNSLHLVVPGGHGEPSTCLETIAGRFMDRGTVEELDTRCTQNLRLPPFVLPDDDEDPTR